MVERTQSAVRFVNEHYSAAPIRSRLLSLLAEVAEPTIHDAAGGGGAPAEKRPEKAWRAGARIVSASAPRLLLYPNFCSPDEVQHLRDLARWGAMEAAAAAGVTAEAATALSWDTNLPTKPAASGRTVTLHLPSPSDDPVIQAIEERCAAVTGIPIHADEEPLGVRHTMPSTAEECAERYVTALHVDTNQGGTYRAATVILYLNELSDVAAGGETRFPLAGVPMASPLRDAAERLTDIGVTAFSPNAALEWPPIACRRALLDAAETLGVGAKVRPQSGLAAVFWTQTTDGLDPYSWHAGARLPPEAIDGKLIVQKFKSLPVQWRPQGDDAVKLPKELAPPAVA